MTKSPDVLYVPTSRCCLYPRPWDLPEVELLLLAKAMCTHLHMFLTA